MVITPRAGTSRPFGIPFESATEALVDLALTLPRYWGRRSFAFPGDLLVTAMREPVPSPTGPSAVRLIISEEGHDSLSMDWRQAVAVVEAFRTDRRS